MNIFIIVVVLAVMGVVTYTTLTKDDGAPEEAERAPSPLEEARSNIPERQPDGTYKKPEEPPVPEPKSSTPASTTMLTPLSSADQTKIRAKGKGLPFAPYVPAKTIQRFSLSSGGASTGKEGNIDIFQIVFLGPDGDSVQIREYHYHEYLVEYDYTPETFFEGARRIDHGNTKVYVATPYTINSRKFQHVQGATVVHGTTLVRISYFGEKELSDADIVELAATFVK